MNVNDYKKIPFRDTINTVLQYLNTYEIISASSFSYQFYMGPSSNKFDGPRVHINLYPDLITVRYYNDDYTSECKIDFGTHKEGYEYFFYGIYDDEDYDGDVPSILNMKTFKYCSTEEGYFQESTIYDYEGITMQDMNSASQLFESIRARIKEKFNK